jgi:hypothetical protein
MFCVLLRFILIIIFTLPSSAHLFPRLSRSNLDLYHSTTSFLIDNHFTINSPTSPSISNVIFFTVKFGYISSTINSIFLFRSIIPYPYNQSYPSGPMSFAERSINAHIFYSQLIRSFLLLILTKASCNPLYM